MALAFGNDIKNSAFVLDKDVTHINHGSFGAAPKAVFEKRLGLLHEQEGDPNGWFRTHTVDHHMDNIAAIAELVGANVDNIVFVDSVTTGINTVLKSLKLTAGDAILLTTFTYKAIQFSCQSYAAKVGASVIHLDISSEHIKSKDDVIARLSDCLSNNSNIKLAVIDYISSTSATLFPVAQMVAVCKQHQVKVAVDAAHAPGQVALNLEQLGQLGMDYLTANMYKWAYTSRGCSFLWVHPRHHDVILPLAVSFQFVYPDTDFRSRFVYNGTIDRSSYYTAAAGIQFIHSIGGIDAILNYTTRLLDEAVEHLVGVWGTHKYPLPRDMEAPNMRLVRLPHLSKFPPPDTLPHMPFGDMINLQTELSKRFKLAAFAAVICGEPYARLSANVYNTIEDYHKLGRAILQLVAEDDA